ncbi:hypothetical protein N7274_15835, partial [Enterococcus faecalis]|nr:hypothetical protein [Enterococcus faecalis]
MKKRTMRGRPQCDFSSVLPFGSIAGIAASCAVVAATAFTCWPSETALPLRSGSGKELQAIS